MPDNDLIQTGERASEESRFMPVMSIELAVKRRNVIVEAVQKLMREDEDYGKIPGTKKPTLYQPGADKLNNLFGQVPRFHVVEKTEDWTGEYHGGEPFFSYTVKCQLWRGDCLMGEGDGSCNSWESKYRYRKSERACPACGKETIIKGKAEYGGGWLCYAKKGGCGAKYADGDAAIEAQITGRVANADVYDVVNTVMKMANKRAKIAATLNATSAHEFFTQDPETEAGGDSGGRVADDPELAARVAEIKDPPSAKAAFDAMRKEMVEYGSDAGAAAFDQITRGAGRPKSVAEWRSVYRSLYGELKAMIGAKAE
jgi:hypothetical protein